MNSFKRLLLGLVLIVACGAILLSSDGAKRKEKAWLIYLIDYSNALDAEETEEGIRAGLRASGLKEGEDYRLVEKNAQGDMAILNNLVDEALSQNADMIYTVTTPALRAAMQKVKDRPVVYSLALDPLLIGDPGTHDRHVPNVAGIYDRAPFEKMMELIKQVAPQAKRLGTLFVPSEMNSVNYKEEMIKAAVAVGLEVEAVPVNSTSEVADAALALTQKDIDIICQINDNLTGNAFAGIVQASERSGIPLFGHSLKQAQQGAVLVVSNDFFDAGFESSGIAAQVIRGEAKPKDVPYRNSSKVKIALNLQSAKRFQFEIPSSLIEKAVEVVDETGKSDAKAEEETVSRLWNIHAIEYVNVNEVEEGERGFRDGLKQAKLVEGKDYKLTVANAQGDMPTISSLIDAALTDKADLLVAFSTPTVQAAVRKASNVPILFTYLASAKAAGIAKSNDEHERMVTGVTTECAYLEMAQLVKQIMPNAKAAGTVFVPAELNTVFHKEMLAAALEKVGIKLEAVAVNTASDIADAALALCSKKLDVVIQISGNLPATGFPSIATAAKRAKIPIFSFLGSQINQGATLVVSRDYYDAGVQTAELAARVLRGESPAKIPIQPTKTTKMFVNEKMAKDLGVAIPDSVLSRAVIIKE